MIANLINNRISGAAKPSAIVAFTTGDSLFLGGNMKKIQLTQGKFIEMLCRVEQPEVIDKHLRTGTRRRERKISVMTTLFDRIARQQTQHK
jgi:hypothetical protein